MHFNIWFVYNDFTKVFDKVNHRTLVGKSKSFGIFDQLLIWLEDYPNEIFQAFKIENIASEYFPA